MQRAEKEGSSECKGRWGVVEADMQDVMRLRYMSYSTEKAYLMWLRAFEGFIAEKMPADVTTADMQNILSYLAVERQN